MDASSQDRLAAPGGAAARSAHWLHQDALQAAEGCGVVAHAPETVARVFAMADTLTARGDGAGVFDVLRAADQIAKAAMWLVVHETYGRRVHLDGRGLDGEDFKRQPEGHTGGALNMVPAYVGYLAIYALAGLTRAWLMVVSDR